MTYMAQQANVMNMAQKAACDSGKPVYVFSTKGGMYLWTYWPLICRLCGYRLVMTLRRKALE